MRSLFLLLLVVLAFLLVRWLYPAPTTAAAEGAAPAVQEQAGTVEKEAAVQETGAPVRFLEPPPESGPRPGPAETSPEPQPVEVKPVPDWPRPAARSAETGGGDGDAELTAAGALIHGTPADVEQAAAALPPARALLVESFAWALAGEKDLARSLAAKIDGEALGGREHALLQAALEGKAATPAAASEGGALLLAMEMGLAAREARAELEAGNHAQAARRYSELLVHELDAPWESNARTLAQWTSGLDEAQRHQRWSPRGAWPSVKLEVQDGDSLIDIRKRYLADHPGALMCTGLIERANAIKGYLQPGQELRIPTDPVRVLVDLRACWALYFLGDEVAGSWPVGIGRAGNETPPGDYVVKDKIENPPWMKVGQEPIPFGDPRNPLGTRWIGWAQDGRPTSYGFHGTQEPDSIGKPSSDGCVRFLNADIEILFRILPEGAPIRVRS